MTALAIRAWTTRATQHDLPTSVVGGLRRERFPATCPDCGYTDPDPEAVYRHLWTCPVNPRPERRAAKRAAA